MRLISKLLQFVLISLAIATAIAQEPAPQAGGDVLSPSQIHDLIQRVADKDLDNNRQQRNYTYVLREVEHKLDGDGKIKSTEIRTYEVMVLYEEPVRKLIARDDKPLPEKEAQKEDEKIQKIIDKRKDEDDGERKKRLAKLEKEQEEGRQFVKEIADAYNFRFVGTESVNGRDAYVIDGEPRPGYEPKMKDARFLPKFRFRAWVDQAESQWVKMDIQCIDTVSVGLFLVRVHKGSNIQIEQVQINHEVWLPKHVSLKLDARVALFKGINMEEDVTYRDYKKFRTNTKITPLGEVKK